MNAKFPRGYYWLLERGLVSYDDNFGPLQPWFYLPEKHSFWLEERWRQEEINEHSFAFAKRQDNDELACMVFNSQGDFLRIDLIVGWIGDGYELKGRFNSFWDWMKHVVDDIGEWVELE